MFRTIVAGSDGRERGRGAVSLASALASGLDARLLLVGVHGLLPVPLSGSFAEDRAELESALRSLRDELAPEAIVRVKASLSPAHALRKVVESEDADLVVVGSRHRRRLQHIVDSDHALQVLRGAPCAVAVAPDPIAAHPRLARIGVGLDATPESERALDIARELAERTGASLQMYVVVDDSVPLWAGLAPVGAPPEVVRELIHRRVTAARELLGERLELPKRARRGQRADGLARRRARPRQREARPPRPGVAPLGPRAASGARQHLGASHPARRVPGARPAPPRRDRAR
jgi:nucleotide-binding universal stress UspA family protein